MSSSTALSLYEKYTELNNKLDATREQRSELEKQVQQTRERLEDYQKQKKPALLQATQQARAKTVDWTTQADQARQELVTLQSQWDAMVKSRDALQQESLARQEKHRVECRNFLAESHTFRQRECPHLHWQLSLLPNVLSHALEGESNESKHVPSTQITRLWAVALANGWDTQGLPPDVYTQAPVQNHFEAVDLSGTFDQIDWDFCDTALSAEDMDDEETRQLVVEYQNERRLFESSQQALHDAQNTFTRDVEEKCKQMLKTRENLQSQLDRLTKQVQQMEVELSTLAMARDMAASHEAAVPATTGNSSHPRVSLSPATTDTVVNNPYQTRPRSTAPRVAPPPPPYTPLPAFHSATRSRTTRKRKSNFGSSIEIGGAEIPRPASPDEKMVDEDDDDEEEELLSVQYFPRKST